MKTQAITNQVFSTILTLSMGLAAPMGVQAAPLSDAGRLGKTLSTNGVEVELPQVCQKINEGKNFTISSCQTGGSDLEMDIKQIKALQNETNVVELKRIVRDFAFKQQVEGQANILRNYPSLGKAGALDSYALAKVNGKEPRTNVEGMLSIARIERAKSKLWDKITRADQDYRDAGIQKNCAPANAKVLSDARVTVAQVPANVQEEQVKDAQAMKIRAEWLKSKANKISILSNKKKRSEKEEKDYLDLLTKVQRIGQLFPALVDVTDEDTGTIRWLFNGLDMKVKPSSVALRLAAAKTDKQAVAIAKEARAQQFNDMQIGKAMNCSSDVEDLNFVHSQAMVNAAIADHLNKLPSSLEAKAKEEAKLLAAYCHQLATEMSDENFLNKAAMGVMATAGAAYMGGYGGAAALTIATIGGGVFTAAQIQENKIDNQRRASTESSVAQGNADLAGKAQVQRLSDNNEFYTGLEFLVGLDFLEAATKLKKGTKPFIQELKKVIKESDGKFTYGQLAELLGITLKKDMNPTEVGLMVRRALNKMNSKQLEAATANLSSDEFLVATTRLNDVTGSTADGKFQKSGGTLKSNGSPEINDPMVRAELNKPLRDVDGSAPKLDGSQLVKKSKLSRTRKAQIRDEWDKLAVQSSDMAMFSDYFDKNQRNTAYELIAALKDKCRNVAKTEISSGQVFRNINGWMAQCKGPKAGKFEIGDLKTICGNG